MARRGLVVLVADLLYRPGARRRVTETGPSDDLRVVASTVAAGSDVTIDAILEWVTDGLLATGTATAAYEGECRRCLTTLRGTVRAQFQELFEFDAREGESYPIKGEHIDLAPLAREALLLGLPLAPLCREDCAGLCPRCGADLNAGACGCRPDDRDPRWAALDVLRGDGEEN
ncbi:MAG: DUF177 domain-containing protein [Actinomycetota bacterium]|nr:DUF177 domain-containing protein [Actinomycetota bacterium]